MQSQVKPGIFLASKRRVFLSEIVWLPFQIYRQRKAGERGGETCLPGTGGRQNTLHTLLSTLKEIIVLLFQGEKRADEVYSGMLLGFNFSHLAQPPIVLINSGLYQLYFDGGKFSYISICYRKWHYAVEQRSNKFVTGIIQQQQNVNI